MARYEYNSSLFSNPFSKPFFKPLELYYYFSRHLAISQNIAWKIVAHNSMLILMFFPVSVSHVIISLECILHKNKKGKF